MMEDELHQLELVLLFFLTTIWLPHSQPVVNHCVFFFLYLLRPEGHQEPDNEVGSLSPTECLVGFELGALRF